MDSAFLSREVAQIGILAPRGDYRIPSRFLRICEGRWCGLDEQSAVQQSPDAGGYPRLAKQYGWTEFPTDESRFSNPWIIGLICTSIVLVTYLLFE